MGLLLSCDSLAKSFGPRPLFSGITLHLDDGQRTGLIGPNGSGKSTLLKIIAGLETPDAGSITSRRQLRLAYLPQQDVFPAGATVHGVMTDALQNTHGDERGQHVRLNVMLGKVGLKDSDQPAETLSGGWRKRLAIARELVKEPELLLLDEPTNHLDVEGIEWLEDLLADAPLGVLMVSHDRYCLENVANRIVELNSTYSGGFLSLVGSYGDFLRKRAEYLESQASQEQSLAGQVRRELEWLSRGAKARRTKAKGRIEEANRMIGELSALRSRNARHTAAEISFAGGSRQTRKLLTAKGVAKSVTGRTLFRDVDFTLAPGTRLGLLGPNGSGKSTLIRLINGESSPDGGEIVRADGLKIVTFDQGRAQLDKSETLRRSLSPNGDLLTYRGQPLHVSGWARRFNFRTDQLDLPVGDLSGGEQARVLIARLMILPADVLILDEPTNDLDIQTLEVLEESLEEFAGAVVLVTHDRFMLDRVSTELLALDGKGNARWHTDLAEWERAREQAAKPVAQSRKEIPKTPKVVQAGLRRLSYMEQREWESMEQTIMQAEADLHAMQRKLDDPAVQADHVKMAACCRDYEAAQQKVRDLYRRWEELDAKQTA